MLHAAVIRRNLPPMLDLFAEILTERRSLTPRSRRCAREVQADLVDSRDDDRSLAGRHFRRTLFAGHPYGRPAAGTAERASRGHPRRRPGRVPATFAATT
jgi:zinc protease